MTTIGERPIPVLGSLPTPLGTMDLQMIEIQEMGKPSYELVPTTPCYKEEASPL